MSEGLCGVVVAHGPMATAMVDAVRKIAGDAADCLLPISNEGKTPASLAEELDSHIGERAAVVFVDLQSGSCGFAALSSCRDDVRRAVISGVNLPMLLDFVFVCHEPIDVVVTRVIERGRAGIVQPGVPL